MTGGAQPAAWLTVRWGFGAVVALSLATLLGCSPLPQPTPTAPGSLPTVGPATQAISGPLTALSPSGWVCEFDDGRALLDLQASGAAVTGTSSWYWVEPPSHLVQSLDTSVSGTFAAGAVSLDLTPAPAYLGPWQGQLSGDVLTLATQKGDGTSQALVCGRSSTSAFADAVGAFMAQEAAAAEAEPSCSSRYEAESAVIIVSGANALSECRRVLRVLTPTAFGDWGSPVAPAVAPFSHTTVACSGTLDGYRVTIYDTAGRLYGGAACDSLGLPRQ